MLDDAALAKLFTEARTHYSWLDKPIPDDVLRKLYDIVRFGPTAANSNPARFVFIRSREAKEKLKPALAPANVEKSMTAAAVVIVAYDLLFYEKLPKLFPHNASMKKLYETNPQLVETTARRNSTLQGAYLIMGARALGLDCGPMSGFDNAKLDEIFFAAGEECDGCEQEFFPKGHVRSNFLINLGYGDHAKLHPRLPRLEFSEACLLL